MLENLKKTEDALFSFFKAPVTNKYPSLVMTLKDVFCYITGMDAREQTLALRKIQDKKKARDFKARNFGYATFAGVFSYDSDDRLVKPSGLMCLDFDHIDVSRVKQILLNDPSIDVQLLFTSPSGDGVKAVVSIDLKKCDYRTWFRGIRNYLLVRHHLEADPSGINVSRACFLPHDMKVYVNPDICPF